MDRVTFRHGHAIRSCDGSPLAGDLVATDGHGAGLGVVVVDVAGSGWVAGRDALQARAALPGAAALPPADAIDELHAVMTGTRGAVAASLRFDGSGSVAYAGVGDILVRRWRVGETDRLRLQPGQLGINCPTVVEQHADLRPGDVVVVTTDGIRAGVELDAATMSLAGSPERAARTIVDQWHRPYDDAACVVVVVDAA